MKNIKNYLGVFAVSFALFIPYVKANDTQVLFEEIHNKISENNKLEVNSISLDKYKDSDYYKKCVSSAINGEEAENICLTEVFDIIVKSYLNFTFEKSDDVYLNTESCNISTSTCDITIGNDEDYRTEAYEISFVGEYNEKKYNNLKKYSSKLKDNYYLTDMQYINQLINMVDEEGSLLSMMYNNYKIFKSFPDIKEDLEKNPKYKYVPVAIGFGGTMLSFGGAGVIVMYNEDGIAMNVSNYMSYNTHRYVYIPDTTEDTIDAYIEAALKRINGYINNEDYKVSIRYDIKHAIELCGDEFNGYCDESYSLNRIFEDNKTYMVRPYILTINGVEYDLAIVPVSDKYIKKLDVNSKDYKNNISIETSSSDVPLDTSVGTLDVTDDHKNKGFAKAYDINLYSEIKEKYISKIKDGVIVRIPVEDNYDKEYVNIYHITDEGKKGERYEAKIEVIDCKKYAVFTTDHFSIYAVEETDDVKVEKDKIENPQTFDGIVNNLVYGVISLISLVGTIIYLKIKELRA